MPSISLENIKVSKLVKEQIYGILEIVFVELALRCALIIAWNYIVTSKLNLIAFGTEDLGFIRGLALLLIVQVIFSGKNHYQDYINNKKVDPYRGEPNALRNT